MFSSLETNRRRSSLGKRRKKKEKENRSRQLDIHIYLSIISLSLSLARSLLFSIEHIHVYSKNYRIEIILLINK